MRRWLRGGLAALVAAAATLWILYAAALWGAQDALIFPAPAVDRAALDADAAAHQVQVVALRAADGTALLGWHRPAGGERLLLYFHGNGGGLGAVPWFADQLPGWDVLCVSYRGYPGSDGRPSEAGLALDARATWRFATDTLGIPADRIVVHAQSLGGGVAIELLTEVQPRALVLDATFTSVESLAAHHAPGVPVRWLLRHPFRSIDRAPRVRTPTLVLHGADDRLIPVEHGRRIAATLPNATYHEVPGMGHDRWLLDDPSAYAAWRTFVDAHR